MPFAERVAFRETEAHTCVPSLFSNKAFTLSVCPLSFISFAQVLGSHTLNTCGGRKTKTNPWNQLQMFLPVRFQSQKLLPSPILTSWTGITQYLSKYQVLGVHLQDCFYPIGFINSSSCWGHSTAVINKKASLPEDRRGREIIRILPVTFLAFDNLEPVSPYSGWLLSNGSSVWLYIPNSGDRPHLSGSPSPPQWGSLGSDERTENATMCKHQGRRSWKNWIQLICSNTPTPRPWRDELDYNSQIPHLYTRVQE